MERFLKFKDEINLTELQHAVIDPRIVVLRKSQITDTIQIRVPEGMSHKQIKRVFGAYEVKKVYNEFPYPVHTDSISKFLVWPLSKIFNRDV